MLKNIWYCWYKYNGSKFKALSTLKCMSSNLTRTMDVKFLLSIFLIFFFKFYSNSNIINGSPLSKNKDVSLWTFSSIDITSTFILFPHYDLRSSIDRFSSWILRNLKLKRSSSLNALKYISHFKDFKDLIHSSRNLFEYFIKIQIPRFISDLR